MFNVAEVAENIYLIDDQLCSTSRLGSVYLLGEEKKALIESGPASSADTVLSGIKQAGVNPEDIAYIVVTHIHLDHAGGAGVLLKEMPRAKVVVHYNGARHMANRSSSDRRGGFILALVLYPATAASVRVK